jgi:hypothetical protein
MGTSFRRGSWAAVLAVAGWLLCQPGTAQAHPHLVGKWSAPVPPGGLMVYEFGPSEYIGNGVWRGPYTYFVSNSPVARGTYELRLFVGAEGTVGLREGPAGATNVATVDLATKVMIFRNVAYRP